MMDCRQVPATYPFSSWPLVEHQRKLVVLIFSHVFVHFSLFLESTWGSCFWSFLEGMDTALVFSTANNPISPCPPNWEVLTALLKLIIVLKNKFVQLLARHHLSNSNWLEINSLCHLSYFEEEEI